jgi:Holliday junction resolvasome RuvABC DNA-binding subunit
MPSPSRSPASPAHASNGRWPDDRRALRYRQPLGRGDRDRLGRCTGRDLRGPHPGLRLRLDRSLLGQPDTRLYTWYHVSERSPTPLLVGFQHEAEREFFRKFIEVPDVGPTKAVRALTRPVSEIARWIEAEDVKSLRELPGIGQRLSQTIVAQLQGKLVQEALLRDASGEAVLPVASLADGLRSDAIEALMALQYTRRDAESAVNEAMDARPELDALRLPAPRRRRGARG